MKQLKKNIATFKTSAMHTISNDDCIQWYKR